MHMLAPEVRRLIERAQPPKRMRTTIVAIDGFGGAGKSTLAAAIAEEYRATTVHTDDFAAWDNPIDWWPRLLAQVLKPLGANQKGHYQRYDWDARQLAEWHDIELGGLVITEGVTSSRREFRPYLSGAIWVDTPPELRLRRGLERDGAQALAQWQQWMAAERQWAEVDRPWLAADLIRTGY